jgi:hypothetical protein
LRFVPAWQNGAPYDGAWNSSYGPRGPLPPAPDVRSSVNPPAPGARVATRSVPVPKPSPLASKPAAEPAKPTEAAIAKPAPEAAKPVTTEAAKPAPQASAQQAAATQAKPAEAAPVTTGSTAPVQAKPAPTIQPTQDMPKAQGLE